MLRNKKRKMLRGSRKIRLRELPWNSYFKVLSLFIVVGVISYQAVSLTFYTRELSVTQLNNRDLSQQVSILSSELKEERIAMESALAEQSDSIVQMRSQLVELNTDLANTKKDNQDLTVQIKSVKSQNDIIRNKLQTILGSASRSGTALSPSPMGQSGLSVNELKLLTKGTKLAGIEEALLKIETAYNCNALFALSVAKLESGSGTSALSTKKNNLFGMRGNSDWFSFKTKSDCVLFFGKMMQNHYFAKGYITLERIGPRYAEGSTTWSKKTIAIMVSDMRKLIK